MDTLALRIAARYQLAREWSSPDALKNYLKDHPNADRSKHHVQKDHGGGGHGKDDHGKGHGKAHGFLGGLRGALKHISQNAVTALKKAPEKAQKFFADVDHRKEILSAAREAIKKSPAVYAQKLVSTAKHEVHEFKTAGSAIAGLMKGKKMTDEQKHAVKTVATHMAITAAAAALTSTGVFAGAAFMGKAMTKHIALKAVGEAIGDLHVLGELGHIGHGVAHIFEKLGAEEGKKLEPEEALAALVAKKVHEQMDKLSDEDLAEALEAATKDGGGEKEEEDDNNKGSSKEASAPEAGAVLLDTLNNIERVHNRLQTWARQAPKVLSAAKRDSEGLPEGWVWQGRLARYWDSYEGYESQLSEIQDRLDDLTRSSLGSNAGVAKKATQPPKQAQIDTVLSQSKFFKDAQGRDDIAYPVRAIEAWAHSFEAWVKNSIRMAKVETAKVQHKMV